MLKSASADRVTGAASATSNRGTEDQRPHGAAGLKRQQATRAVPRRRLVRQHRMGIMMCEAPGQRDLQPQVTWIPLAG